MNTQTGVGYLRQTDTLLDEILSAVASAEECRKLELPPLYQSVDAEMLGRVVESPGVIDVSFQYCGYTVTIEGDRHVHVAPLRE